MVMDASRLLELRTDKESVPETLIVAFGDKQRKRRRLRDEADDFASFADCVPLKYRLLRRGEDVCHAGLASIMQAPPVVEAGGSHEELETRLAAATQRAVFDELVLGLDRFRLAGVCVKEFDGKLCEVLKLEAMQEAPRATPKVDELETGGSANRKRVLQRDEVDHGVVYRYALDVEFHRCQGLGEGLKLEEVKARLRDSFISQVETTPGIGFVDLGDVAYDRPIAPELLSRRGIHKGTQEGIEADRQDATFYDKYKDVHADDESDGVGDENESVDYPSSSNEGSEIDMKRPAALPKQLTGAFFADSDDSDRSSLASSLSSANPEDY